MPGSQFAERGLLDQLFGSVIGQVNQTITAPAAATAAITVRGSAGSGNIDTTPAAGQYLLMGTPGSGATQNQVSNLDVVQVTSATGTSVIIPAQTIGKSRAVGDYIWIIGTTTGGASPGFIFNDTWYIGLTTQAVSGATQANVLSNEPTSQGGYTRIAALDNAANFGAATGVGPATKANAAVLSHPASTAAWSTGATNLVQLFIADSPTLGAGNVFGFGALTTPQAVNAASITLSYAIGALTVTCS